MSAPLFRRFGERFGRLLDETAPPAARVLVDRVQNRLCMFRGDQHLDTQPLGEHDVVALSAELERGRVTRGDMRFRYDYRLRSGGQQRLP